MGKRRKMKIRTVQVHIQKKNKCIYMHVRRKGDVPYALYFKIIIPHNSWGRWQKCIPFCGIQINLEFYLFPQCYHLSGEEAQSRSALTYVHHCRGPRLGREEAEHTLAFVRWGCGILQPVYAAQAQQVAGILAHLSVCSMGSPGCWRLPSRAEMLNHPWFAVREIMAMHQTWGGSSLSWHEPSWPQATSESSHACPTTIPCACQVCVC